MEYRLSSPFDTEELKRLRAGDLVRISGCVYVARDAAHKRMQEALDAGKELPFDISGQTI